jgi:hypothetical protein
MRPVALHHIFPAGGLICWAERPGSARSSRSDDNREHYQRFNYRASHTHCLMSNQTLIARIKDGLERFRSREISASKFAEIVRENGRSLEGVPYDLIKDMESLAHDFDIERWYEEDGSVQELEPILRRTLAWLAMLPRMI